MKKHSSLLYLIVIGLGIMACQAQMQISEPQSLDSSTSLPEHITTLAKHLKEGNVREFYRETQFASTPSPSLETENIHEHINFCLWRTYLIAQAPFFTKKTFLDNALSSDSLRDTQDLEAKRNGIMQSIRYMVLINDSKHIKNSDKKRYIQEYLLPYCSLMIYQLKNFKEEKEVVDKEKLQKEWDSIDLNTPEGVEKMMLLINGDGNIPRYDIKLRNEKAVNTFRPATTRRPTSSTNQMIMYGLLKIYPDKYPPIEKFLLDSGFNKQEIRDLINQAVRRSPKTEFLYQEGLDY